MNKAFSGLAAAMSCWALTSSLLLASPALGQSSQASQTRGFDEDFDDALKAWQEIEARMPARPVAENMVPFEVSGATTYKFAVDSKSISIGSDGVVRYTLVATSARGALNVSYEGIRCTTREVKLYAFGRPDGSWSRSKRDQWERIEEATRNRQHAALRHVVCETGTPVKNVAEVVSRLRNPPEIISGAE